MDIGSMLGTFSTRFLGIFSEAVSFLLLGTLISGLSAVFVNNDDIARLIPHNPIAATLVGSMLGFIFPVCECGVVPVTRRLYQSGQQADVIGFMNRDIRFKNTSQFMAARFGISCCVADARAIGVITQLPKASTLAQDSWGHLKGKFTIQTFDGQRPPILVVDSLEPTNQPDHSYLYP